MSYGFGSTLGSGTTDAVLTASMSRNAVYSYHIRANRNGSGGGNIGAMFRALLGSGGWVYFANSPASGGIYELQVGFSTTNGVWSVVAPATGTVKSIVIRHDASSTANDPEVLFDGVFQTVTRLTAPAGTFDTTAGQICIGNNALTGGTRNWDGTLQDFCRWDVKLEQAYAEALADGMSPLLIHPESLVEYIPMTRDAISRVADVPSVTGTVVRSDARRIGYQGFLAGSLAPASAAATATTLSGPDRGFNGAPSSNFTVGADGTITGTVTITPSDGGAGGAFSPSSLQISAGTPTATFTYTPASYGPITVTAANDGGLTAGTASYKSDSTDYYLASTGSDAANGATTGTPWQTAAQIATWGWVRGATYHFNGGDTFSAALTISDGNDGAVLADMVTLTSYGTGQALLSQSSTTTNVVTIAGCGGVTIDNVKLAGAGDRPSLTSQYLVYIAPPASGTIQRIYVKNCELYNAKTAIYMRPSAAGPYAKFSTIEFTGNTVHHCYQRGVNFSYLNDVSGIDYTWVSGLKINGNTIYTLDDPEATALSQCFGIVVSYADGAEIKNNLLHDFGANATNSSGGFFCWGDTRNAIVSGNEVYNMYRNGVADGMGIVLDSGSQNCLVEYNYIHDCDGSGLACFAYIAGGKPAGVGLWRNNTFRYNVVQQCGKEAWGSFSTGGDDLDGCDVYGNTFAQTSTVSPIFNFEPTLYATTAAKNFRFLNNVLIGATNAVGMVRANSGSGTESTHSFRNNSFYPVTGTNQIAWFGSNYSTIAAWAAVATDVSGSVTADPLLTDPFTAVVFDSPAAIVGLTKVDPASGSPLIGAGLDLTSAPYSYTITRDFKGNTAPVSTLDIGAVEAQATSPTHALAATTTATASLPASVSPEHTITATTTASASLAAFVSPVHAIVATGIATASMPAGVGAASHDLAATTSATASMAASVSPRHSLAAASGSVASMGAFVSPLYSLSAVVAATASLVASGLVVTVDDGALVTMKRGRKSLMYGARVASIRVTSP